MQRAMAVNELARLGDRMIGTRAPLRLRLNSDPDRTSAMAADGSVSFTIGQAQIFCDNAEVTDPVEQEIAWIFMQYGEWQGHEPKPILDGNRLVAIEFDWEAKEPTDQGFEIIGSLSRMFARHYAEHTIEENAVVQLRAPLKPHWFAPLLEPNYRSKALPLWRFVQQPNYDLPPADVRRARLA